VEKATAAEPAADEVDQGPGPLVLIAVVILIVIGVIFFAARNR
jgi:hypothetical protein